ncbi:hypothetical protein GLA29479_4603 [Lysobacter antibioticus]|nr:hypothetical protein GLA29479_4603 [Lysobacter antibioticus]
MCDSFSDAGDRTVSIGGFLNNAATIGAVGREVKWFVPSVAIRTIYR